MGNNVNDVLSNFLMDGTSTSKVSKWYVESMLANDVKSMISMMDDADRDELEFLEVMTRVSEVLDKEKLVRAYNVIGLMLSASGVSLNDKKGNDESGSVDTVADSLVTRGNLGYVKSDRSARDRTLDHMREDVNDMLRIPEVGNSTSSVDVLKNRLNGVLDASLARIVDTESTDDADITSVDVAEAVDHGGSLSEKERQLLDEGYKRSIEKDDLGNEHVMYSHSFDRIVVGYMGMKEVCEALGKSEPYVKRIARMLGAVTVRNRFYADERLVERVRSELVSIKKIGNGYMSVTDFALAANMTRRGAMRVMRTRLDYKERNTNIFVKRSAANKFIRENAESVPNPFEYVTVREIEYATGIMITSEYTDSDSVSSGLSLKYRNNRMVLMSELLRMLEVRGKLDTFNVKVRNELLLDYMAGYLELKNVDEKRAFRAEAGVYGRYLQNMDDLEDPKKWYNEMLANEEYMSFARVLETAK